MVHRRIKSGFCRFYAPAWIFLGRHKPDQKILHNLKISTFKKVCHENILVLDQIYFGPGHKFKLKIAFLTFQKNVQRSNSVCVSVGRDFNLFFIPLNLPWAKILLDKYTNRYLHYTFVLYDTLGYFMQYLTKHYLKGLVCKI